MLPFSTPGFSFLSLSILSALLEILGRRLLPSGRGYGPNEDRNLIERADWVDLVTSQIIFYSIILEYVTVPLPVLLPKKPIARLDHLIRALSCDQDPKWGHCWGGIPPSATVVTRQPWIGQRNAGKVGTRKTHLNEQKR